MSLIVPVFVFHDMAIIIILAMTAFYCMSTNIVLHTVLADQYFCKTSTVVKNYAAFVARNLGLTYAKHLL